MRRAVSLIILLVVLLLIPLMVEDSYVRHLFILAFVYAVIASNWDLSLGYAGLFNFGHTAFFAVGVYTAAILAKTFDINPWIALWSGGFTAAAAALIMAGPIARLKGIYVVLVSFAFSQLMIQLILSQSEITGGAEGMVRIPYLSIGDYKFIKDYKLGYYYVGLFILSVSTVFLLWVTSSPLGKSFLALRDNEDYALARGISITRQRIIALVLSAVFPGIIGSFFAIYLRVASTEVLSFGTLSLSLSILLVGGTATTVGPIAASFFIVFANEAMAGIQGMEEIRFVIVALAMIIILRFTPNGLASFISVLTRQNNRGDGDGRTPLR